MQDWIRQFLGPLLPVAIMGLGIGALYLALERAEKDINKGKRSPFPHEFLRGPGHSLYQRIENLLVDFMGWENYDTRIEPVQKIDLARGETLVIDREVLDDIRRVFRTGAWKMRTDDPR